PATGLAFDLLAAVRSPDGSAPPVTTGHSEGVITVAVAEANDATREAHRTALREPYRTLLGHFRHEIAHYYWDRLVRDG
ncbi:putative zinc-binding metallopeptidase, partial [Mycobacterium tuberculosis]|nr:putative zinc-binding metallopeptidase [Mycobacterium tuberculosis]